MTTELIVRFFMQQPFEPVTLVLSDGRELHVNHPEQAVATRGGSVIYYYHPTSQVEVIDSAMVISLRTIHAVDLDSYRE